MATATASTTILLPVEVGVQRNESEPVDSVPRSVSKNGCIEIDIGDVRIRVRGAVDADALRCVLAAVARLLAFKKHFAARFKRMVTVAYSSPLWGTRRKALEVLWTPIIVRR